MKVMVTGTEGYIGVLLARRLVEAGHRVAGLDTGYYRDGWLYSRAAEFTEFVRGLNKDLRHLELDDLQGFDAVVHLAELSNDPLGENSPKITQEINHLGSVRLARLAKDAGVKRFVYTSSCSVYGVSDAEFVDESSVTNPQTAYARCKVMVERDVGELAGPDFHPVFLRNATAFGPSPRMRFDIVLNNLAGLAWTTRKIAMTSDGSPWRPLVHVDDICTAILCALEAPAGAVSGEVFNVGATEQNYQVREIAEIVAQVMPGCELTFGAPSADNRSYRVNFDKIRSHLPGFACRWKALDGARQLRSVFEQIQMDETTFGFRAFTRLKQLKYLISTGQIDDHFFWKL